MELYFMAMLEDALKKNDVQRYDRYYYLLLAHRIKQHKKAC